MAGTDLMDNAESLKAAEIIANFNECYTNSPILNDRAQATSVIRSKVQRKPRQMENTEYKRLKTRLLDTKESIKLRNLSATFYRQGNNTGKLSAMSDTKCTQEDKFMAAKLSRAIHAGDLVNELIVRALNQVRMLICVMMI